MKPLFGVLIPALERHRHIKLDPAVRAKLLNMGTATIDRLLKTTRLVATPGMRRRAPTRLRQTVPVRTFADWKEPDPGSMEMDLVAHCGESNSGSYVHSLVLTDVHSGWTESVPLVVREATLVAEAIESVRVSLPFTLRCLDTDNGTEFVNDILVQYCVQRGIELTRSRPWRKNDQAWIEQKNGAVIRKLVGYHRFEGLAAAQALARLYSASRLFVNFFQPSFKLLEKTRIGATVRKRYATPLTPHARLLLSPVIPESMKVRLRAVAEGLDPLRLLDEIRSMQQHLLELSQGGDPHTPPTRNQDLSVFLASLATAWRAGEVRPTHAKKQRKARHWRTRKDPFAEHWPEICRWLEEKPDMIGRELFARLRDAHPGLYRDGQIRTLFERLAAWRSQAARRLIFEGTSDHS